jgi:hypothetical protein
MGTLEIVLLALLIVSVALHVIAPRTKNTYDDAAADVVDAVRDTIAKQPPKTK